MQATRNTRDFWRRRQRAAARVRTLSAPTALLAALVLAATGLPAPAQTTQSPPPTAARPLGVDAPTALRPTLPSAPARPAPPGGSWAPIAPGTAAAPGAPALKGPVPDRTVPAVSNTTVIPRSGGEARTGGVAIRLEAQLTEEGQSIDQTLLWRVFRARAGADGKFPLVSEHKEAAPNLRLDPGDYIVNAALGRANLTRRITVSAGKAATERFVLNAGGLRIAALLAGGETAPDKTVAVDIYSDERDQLGQRVKVLGPIRPGVVVRLNAGIYQIVSTYGDANAIVRADVTVEPGKLTEAGVSHGGGKITFKLVDRAGGDALADTQWSIASAAGETVKETAGALPTHILAAGAYSVSARRDGRSYRRDFTVRTGETAEVELLAQ